MKEKTRDSLPYIAPEVLSKTQENQISPENTLKADIWSFGITCIELAKGKTPYDGMSVGDMSKAIQEAPPPTLDGSWSPELVDLVTKCCKKEYAARYVAGLL